MATAKTATKKFHVVKTVCRVLTADMTRSGKVETILTKLYYKSGAWVSEENKNFASKMSKDQAKKIVLSLDNDDFDVTFDWIAA